MKISELITELNEKMQAHGDVPVRFPGEAGDADIISVSAFDGNGNSPGDGDFKGPVCEAYISDWHDVTIK